MPGADLHHLPLEALHEAAGAKFGAFAGWSMPLLYPPGVLKEHQHTRQKAGLFDISHMKLIAVEGAEAAELLSQAAPSTRARWPGARPNTPSCSTRRPASSTI